MIVAKFGGTSVADAPAIERLAKIIRARTADQPVVVVSALAKVTDALLALGKPVAAGDQAAVDAAIEALVERHDRTAAGLPGAAAAMPAIRADAGALRGEMIAALGRPLTPAALDAVAGRGELWSSRLITAALQGAGLDAVWVDIRPIMRTDDRFTRATPQMDHLKAKAQACFRPLAEGGRIAVTQGFIGATAEGIPTTLGRGGSDYTAALLGAALHATRVEIWTDVCGLMTADPRIVPSARTLAQASYDEAAELATFGAKVLHPATALPLVQAGIPIVVLNSTEAEHPGTVIRPEAQLERLGDSPIRSISWKKGITVINIRAPRMLGAFGFLRRLFEIFERHEVVVDVLASSEVSISLSIEDTSSLDALVKDLSELGEIRVASRRAIIAVVGVGLHTTAGIAGRLFSTVTPVNVEIISQGASAINVTFIVQEEDGPEVVRKLHQEFFGSC